MADYTNQVPNTGLFIPTTNVWEISDKEGISDEQKELFVRLYQNINNIALALNLKDSAIYNQPEFLTGAKWFPLQPEQEEGRDEFRVVVNFGALPNNAAKSVVHGIPNIGSTFVFVDWKCMAFDPIALKAIPIPYVSLLGRNIQMDVDATNVTITTNFNWSSYTMCYVVLVYLKQNS